MIQGISPVHDAVEPGLFVKSRTPLAGCVSLCLLRGHFLLGGSVGARSCSRLIAPAGFFRLSGFDRRGTWMLHSRMYDCIHSKLYKGD